MQLFGKYAVAAVLKTKAPGAEVGCKNALFVAGAQATNKIVPMPQTVCRGISAPILTPGFATFSLTFFSRRPSAKISSVKIPLEAVP